jgi:hypothetical protein
MNDSNEKINKKVVFMDGNSTTELSKEEIKILEEKSDIKKKKKQKKKEEK